MPVSIADTTDADLLVNDSSTMPAILTDTSDADLPVKDSSTVSPIITDAPDADLPVKNFSTTPAITTDTSNTDQPIKESNIDVLIIGAGPAGYMAAIWFARLGINARIIDKRGTKIFTGQADGLQPRALEVFNSFGFAHRPLKEASVGFESCYYEPDANGHIHKVARKVEGVVGISRFNGSVIHQGRIEQWFTDAIDEFSNNTLQVERPLLPESLVVDESKIHDQSAYPITVTVKKLSDDDSVPDQFGHKLENGLYRQFAGDQEREFATPPESREIIHAKYVLGTDGAHSWVRKQLGIVPEGESTDYIWGVLDIVPITNLPDIRKRCAIHSVSDGSIMIIPREGDLVRFYIQLKETAREPEDGSPPGTKARVDRSKITPELILERARKILHPYTLDVAETQWFTGYQIGQRVAPKFEKWERVFIAGDACHTHSPKAGQGMNISMMDTFNLAWKIAHVVQGKASPAILSTYEDERRQVAKDLIDYDFKLSRLFSGKPGTGDGTISTDEFRDFIDKGSAFTTGCTVDYGASALVSKPPREDSNIKYASPLATELFIGMRFPDSRLVMQCDGRPWFIHDKMPSDGRWRLIDFSGDIKSSPTLAAQLVAVGHYFSSPESFIAKYTPADERVDSVIELILVHASDANNVEWDDFPLAFRSRDSRRVMDYWKIYGDMESLHGGTGDAYEKLGIKRDVGALVVVRPDGYVSMVTTPDMRGINEVGSFFDGFLIPATR
ncbi:related to phenol 2-monooxygenase [Cephalotrichum gorgonifer]|uniref:Related to phenol 2-monooxygenase n=1 Tax=Cephalotrichum gorgonifer TaxID=2041049 RepID=A0AAE8SX05_9PEZI|nr:related to phenol 2-monooxygenase [Cephalotrichum gorgonifer]